LNFINRKWLGITGGLLMLPIVACAPETAQTPQDTVSPPSPGLNESPAATAPTTGDRTIADLAASDNSLSTFNTVLDAAGMTETLRGQGPYTVFAPSNEAFAEIPEATREQLLRPENREKLRQVLSYHVVDRNLPANQLQSGDVNTIAGQSLNVQVNQGTQQVNVNGASVTQPNLVASNGVVHVVDQVILPPNFSL